MPRHPPPRLACALILAAAAAPAFAAKDPGVPGEILVKLASTAALAPVLARHPVALVRGLGQRPVYRLRVTGSSTVSRVIRELQADPDVQLAEQNRLHQSPEARKNVAWAIGTESEYRAQWAPQAMHLPEAQQIADVADRCKRGPCERDAAVWLHRRVGLRERE